MSRTRKVLGAVLVVVMLGLVFLYAQVDIASKSIQFDLRMIGASVYEARARNGKWPARIGDLAGTIYLKLPYRRTMLEEGRFVVVWHQDLHPHPEDNRDRVLAFDNGSLLSRGGWPADHSERRIGRLGIERRLGRCEVIGCDQRVSG